MNDTDFEIVGSPAAPTNTPVTTISGCTQPREPFEALQAILDESPEPGCSDLCGVIREKFTMCMVFCSIIQRN